MCPLSVPSANPLLTPGTPSEWVVKHRYSIDSDEQPARTSSPGFLIKGPISAITPTWERGSKVGTPSNVDPSNGQRGVAHIDRDPSCCQCCCLFNCLCCLNDNALLKYICRTPDECAVLTQSLNGFSARDAPSFAASILRVVLSATENDALLEYQGFSLSVLFEETLPYAVSAPLIIAPSTSL